ncbi:MAG: type II toxin-antitoxin system mRNA interferase toxin, RelE/StbE family [Stenomitos rutilans HA7619-LM2]|nr:type II toxin-antitoxin system mRNA interferase toxin, RelE/StbE family [Stenomitos rutilans HA7619-LM2]
MKRDQQLQQRIEGTLLQMQQEVFAPNLGTHKLEGQLQGLLACSCGYDCRVVFLIEKDKETGSEAIILLDIGTHDEIY